MVVRTTTTRVRVLDLSEKAVSKKQQRFFGLVRAAHKGELKNPSQEVVDVADNISVKDAKDFASTKHKGLPERKKKIDERLNPGGYVMSGQEERKADKEKENKEKDLRMTHGKKWRDFTDEAKAKREKEKEILARYKEKKEKGIPFYDKYGSGYIRDGRKVYVYKKR